MSSNDKVSILLVDDQPARLLTYETILGSLGQKLVRAASGREALEQVMKREFAVVLMDVSMPDIDGFEAARLIHEHPRFEKTPIIFVTGVHVSELDRLRGYEVGAVDYVQVPVVPEILRSKVAVLVELYCKRQELQKLNNDLARANAELASLNVSLRRVNAEAETANRSLQSEVVERVKAERKLRERDRLKDEFLAMLAHELRNPLAPIQSAVEMMRRQPIGDPHLLRARDIIERQLTQMRRLVDDLLDVSRITRGQINLRREPVDIPTLVAHAVETVKPLIDERGHQLSIDTAGGSVEVLGDTVRLTQALANLLSNAAKYTEPGGHIRVAAQVRDGQVELSIRDSGIGIRADHLPVIFDLFTQLGGTPGRLQGGLGIGLALVKKLVQMHQGRVSARSEGPGRGSEFLVSLPVHARREAAAAAGGADAPAVAAEKEGAQPAANPRRILVADDNIDALESLALLLELTGHTVYTAVDGRQTLEAAERNQPEVLLLDISMPVLDGYEVARRIRAQPWGRHMILIALTGRGLESDRCRSREAGFDAHLVKPVDLESLTAALARGLPRAQTLSIP